MKGEAVEMVNKSEEDASLNAKTLHVATSVEHGEACSVNVNEGLIEKRKRRLVRRSLKPSRFDYIYKDRVNLMKRILACDNYSGVARDIGVTRQAVQTNSSNAVVLNELNQRFGLGGDCWLPLSIYYHLLSVQSPQEAYHVLLKIFVYRHMDDALKDYAIVQWLDKLSVIVNGKPLLTRD